jgi:hypothetical protein
MTDYLPPPPPGGGWNQAGPYGQTSAALPPMRSLRGLVTALTVMFVLVVLVELFGVSAMFNRAGLLDDAANGEFPSFEAIDDADSRVAAAMAFHIFSVLAVGIVFIVWQFRHAKNAEALGARGGLGPGWAIGGWFVPIANYVLPAMQLFQSSKASDVEARQIGRQPKGESIIVLWAVAFALASIIFVIGGGLADTDEEGNFEFRTLEDIEDAANGDRTAGAAMVLYGLTALIAIGMVRSLSARQTAAWAKVTAITAAQPQPGPGSWAPPPPAAPPAPPPPPPGAPPPPT